MLGHRSLGRGALVVGVTALVTAGSLIATEANVAASPGRGEADGVIVALTHRGTVISFHREARRAFAKIAGRSIKLTCVTLATDPIQGMTTDGGSFSTIVQAPRRRRPFASAYWSAGVRDVCSIVRRAITRRVGGGTETFPARRIAVIPLTPKGARYVAEATVAEGLESIMEFATAEVRRGSLPTFAGLDPKRVNGVRVVPLDTADATPPAGDFGYFSEGASATAVGVAKTRRRLFVTRGKEGLFSTNASNYLFDPAF